jgi:hypothetical protein
MDNHLIPPEVIKDNNMFMGFPRFPQYLFYRYKRKHPHRMNKIVRRKINGYPDWWAKDSYSRLIEKTNKRRKKNVRTK